MGFEVFMQRTGNQKLISFPRSILAEILGPSAVFEHDGEISGARFSDDDFGRISGAEEENITFLAFRCGGEKFMQMMWDLADKTRSYIFWPEGEKRPHLVVTSNEILAQLEQDVLDWIGPAIVVKNGEELSDAIFGDEPASSYS